MRSGCFQGPREWVPLEVGGRRKVRPSAHEGEPGECKWAWEAAGPEPWASRTPGSEIQPRGSGHVWHSARAPLLVLVTAWFTMYTSGSPALSPGELLGGVAAVRVELVVVKPSLLLYPGHTWCPAAAAPPGTPSTLTGGLSFSSLKAPAVPVSKYFERTKLSMISLEIKDISQALESKAFLYVFMAGIRDNTALVKGKTFSKYFPPLKFFFSFFW